MVICSRRRRGDSNKEVSGFQVSYRVYPNLAAAVVAASNLAAAIVAASNLAAAIVVAAIVPTNRAISCCKIDFYLDK